MFLHIRKFSSTVKAASPISVLCPKNNNKDKVVRPVIDQTRFLDEEESSKKKPAAAGTLLDQISLRPVELTDVDDMMPLLDQISLRPVELTDVDDMMLWSTDELSRYCGWERGIYTSKEDALEDIENYIIHHSWYRAICLKNRSIGKIFVDSYYKDNPCFGELGYAVASKHWGKGIATTAVKMVLGTVFKECPHLERLDALVNVKNLGSVRVLEKAGFKNKGVIRGRYTHKGKTIDKAIFRFLSTDFKRRLD